MRLILGILLLLLLGTFAPPRMHRPHERPAEPILRFEPLAVGQSELGRGAKAQLLGAWSLRSNHPGFGGISAMHVAGTGVLALSDGGAIFSFGLPDTGSVQPLSVTAIADHPGSKTKKSSRDVEALAMHGGTIWIAFENQRAIWRYALPRLDREAGAAPREMAQWSRKSGPEAMVRLADGRFLVFREGIGGDRKSSEVLLFGGDPAAGASAVRLGYRPPDGYRITDAALLPDGRILYLNRSFSLTRYFRAKLSVGRLHSLAEGALLEGEEIADLGSPALADNFEALSVTREDGRTIIWIASDDNFSPLQRNLLLKLALADQA